MRLHYMICICRKRYKNQPGDDLRISPADEGSYMPVVSMTQKMACVDRIFPESIRTFMKVVCKHEKCGLLDMIF